MILAARSAVLASAAVMLIGFGGSGARADEGVADTGGLGRAATLASACSGCHLEGGAAIVGLGGRSADDIRSSLAAYKAAASGTSVMHRIARGYSEEEMRLIADHLAARKGR